MKLNTTRPPKNRDFLGLAELDNGDVYWDIFFWATPEYGVRKSCFTDRQLFDMPTLRGWVELPDIE